MSAFSSKKMLALVVAAPAVSTIFSENGVEGLKLNMDATLARREAAAAAAEARLRPQAGAAARRGATLRRPDATAGAAGQRHEGSRPTNVANSPASSAQVLPESQRAGAAALARFEAPPTDMRRVVLNRQADELERRAQGVYDLADTSVGAVIRPMNFETLSQDEQVRATLTSRSPRQVQEWLERQRVQHNIHLHTTAREHIRSVASTFRRRVRMQLKNRVAQQDHIPESDLEHLETLSARLTAGWSNLKDTHMFWDANDKETIRSGVRAAASLSREEDAFHGEYAAHETSGSEERSRIAAEARATRPAAARPAAVRPAAAAAAADDMIPAYILEESMRLSEQNEAKQQAEHEAAAAAAQAAEIQAAAEARAAEIQAAAEARVAEARATAAAEVRDDELSATEQAMMDAAMAESLAAAPAAAAAGPSSGSSSVWELPSIESDKLPASAIPIAQPRSKAEGKRPVPVAVPAKPLGSTSAAGGSDVSAEVKAVDAAMQDAMAAEETELSADEQAALRDAIALSLEKPTEQLAEDAAPATGTEVSAGDEQQWFERLRSAANAEAAGASQSGTKLYVGRTADEAEKLARIGAAEIFEEAQRRRAAEREQRRIKAQEERAAAVQAAQAEAEVRARTAAPVRAPQVPEVEDFSAEIAAIDAATAAESRRISDIDSKVAEELQLKEEAFARAAGHQAHQRFLDREMAARLHKELNGVAVPVN